MCAVLRLSVRVVGLHLAWIHLIVVVIATLLLSALVFLTAVLSIAPAHSRHPRSAPTSEQTIHYCRDVAQNNRLQLEHNGSVTQ